VSALFVGSFSGRIIGISVQFTFFSRILEYFVCFRMAVGEYGSRLFQFGIALHSMTHGQHGFVIQFQLCDQFSCRFAFANTSPQQDNLLRSPLATLKKRSGVQVVVCSAMFTSMNFQLAGLGMPELSSLFYASLALRALEPFWMKMLEEPRSSIFIVSQFLDWNFHASSLPLHHTSFTYEPRILKKPAKNSQKKDGY